MTDEAIETWTGALEDVLHCVPREIRERVLTALLEKERERQREPSDLIEPPPECPCPKCGGFAADDTDLEDWR